MRLLIKFLVTALLVFLASKYLLSGITLSDGYTSALIFSIILALINITLGFILRILGFPINIITLGLFSFFVTIFVIWVTTKLYSGIQVEGVLAYLFLAFLPAITSVVVSLIRGKK